MTIYFAVVFEWQRQERRGGVLTWSVLIPAMGGLSRED